MTNKDEKRKEKERKERQENGKERQRKESEYKDRRGRKDEEDGIMKWSQEMDLREETGQDRRQKTRQETG
jgi:hypothetical protein